MKLLDQNYLDKVSKGLLDKGWPISKWVQFSQTMIQHGWTVRLQQSKTTVSKYIHITKGKKHYKIRFSNHMPAKTQESRQDSDFYVGVSHNDVVTTEQLITKLIS